MHSFILNQQQSDQVFTSSSQDSEFKLLKVVIKEFNPKISLNDLQKYLSGFYLEIEEICTIHETIVRSRSRPFELSKQIDASDHSIYFNQSISNESFDVNGVWAFYDRLKVKLISRYDIPPDPVVQIIYEGQQIVQVSSFLMRKSNPGNEMYNPR